MSVDNIIPDFEKLLADNDVNSLIEFLIKDQAFSVEFLASTIACYYLNEKKQGDKKTKNRG